MKTQNWIVNKSRELAPDFIEYMRRTLAGVGEGEHKVIDSAGAEAVASGKVYVPGNPAVTLYSKVTLPDGTQPPVIAVDRVGDQLGSNHLVLHYGKA